MPRCPKDSKYKIGLYRTPVKLPAGGERTTHHRVVAEGKCEAFPPCLWGAGGALGYEVPHCGGEPPALACCWLSYYEVRVNTFVDKALTFSVLYTLL